MSVRSALFQMSTRWSILTIIIAGFTSSLHEADAFVLLLPPPGQGLAMSNELPIEPFDSLGRGRTSFRQIADDAAQAWNDVGVGEGLDDAFFSNSNTAAQFDPCEGMDGINTMKFAELECGFEWGDTLGVTVRRWFKGDPVFEADITFSATAEWDAYTGPVRILPGIGQVEDFTRTAIHEYGHALGLDHPDDVDAIMNSRAGDTDSIQADDRDGAHAVEYSPPAFDFRLDVTPVGRFVMPGEPATYTITATFVHGVDVPIDLFSLFGDCPEGAACRFSGVTVTESNPVIVTIETTADTPLGQYQYRVAGTTGGVTRLAIAGLNVTTEDFGRIIVTVKDDLEKPVAGAKIKLKNRTTKSKVKDFSDEKGGFTSPPIEPGEYKVVCKKDGFEKLKLFVLLDPGEELGVTCILYPKAVKLQ